MKKIMSFALACIIGACVFCACDGGSSGGSDSEIKGEEITAVDYDKRADSAVYPKDGAEAYSGKQTVGKLAVTKNGDRYLEVDGKPFLYLGAQLRTDFFLQLDGYTLDDLGYLFKLASRLNITCIQVPVCWSDIETAENVYSAAYIEKIMEFADKYSLKLELLWFGSYMCTYTVADDGNANDNRHGNVPAYIYNNPELYPALGYNKAGNKFLFDGWLGKQYLLMPATTALLERECAAVNKMMEFVYEYDRFHGGKHTVIGVQAENEADGMIYWRFAEFDENKTYEAVKDIVPSDVTAETLGDYCYQQMLVHVNAIGKAVKDSMYSCLTRANLTLNTNWEERSEDFVSLDYIDFVGVDPYDSSAANIKRYIKFLNRLDGNFAHIAENGGEFMNNDILELSAFSEHGGYSVFEVVCTSNPELKDWELRGVFSDLGNCRFAEKPQAPYLMAVNRALKDGHAAIAAHDGMNVLNGETSEGAKVNLSEGKLGDFSYSCKTVNRGVGYVAKYEDYIYFASTESDEFSFTADNYDKTAVEVGYFDSKNVWHTEQTINAKSGKLKLVAKRCYRIKKVK